MKGSEKNVSTPIVFAVLIELIRDKFGVILKLQTIGKVFVSHIIAHHTLPMFTINTNNAILNKIRLDM